MTYFNPCPKPAPREKKERKPLKRGRVKRVNRKHRDAEFIRAYHSEERVSWVRSLPCIVCGQGPCDNAHTVTGGMGRKADYQTIVPLCSGHHQYSHIIGIETFQEMYGVDLSEHAERTERLWQLVSGLRHASAPEGFTEKVMERIGE